MKRLSHFLLLASGLLWAGLTARADSSEPIQNFATVTFTPSKDHNTPDYHSLLLRGSQAQMLTPRLIQLNNMNLTVFSGDASNRIDSILLSPVARVSLDDDIARGPGTVRLIQYDKAGAENLELTGEQWTYEHAQKRISLHKNVHVVFHAELNDLLK